jgi:hypothetical protein
MTMTTKAERPAEFKTMLGRILDELTNMAPGRIGSQWHADRCSEARHLATRIEILTAAIVKDAMAA